jgi:peptidyl-prolyl cis-trans isomerase SurA
MIHAVGDARADERRVVDRVIAVIGREPILASELHARAAPFLMRVPKSASLSERAAAEQQIFRELLDKVIDERLEEREAERVHMTIDPEEVAKAIAAVAAQNGFSVARVFEEAKNIGIPEREYREEVRRQLLEGKLIYTLPATRRLQVSDAEIDGRLPELVRDAKGAAVTRDAARQVLMGEKLQRVRQDWLKGLRAEVYLEVRL